MLAKYIDITTVQLQTAVHKIIDGEKQIINPTDSDYISVGFVEFIEQEMPQNENFYYTPQYEVSENKIIQSWVAHEFEPTDDEIENRLSAVEETTDTTATAVEELINVVMGGDK